MEEYKLCLTELVRADTIMDWTDSGYIIDFLTPSGVRVLLNSRNQVHETLVELNREMDQEISRYGNRRDNIFAISVINK